MKKLIFSDQKSNYANCQKGRDGFIYELFYENDYIAAFYDGT